MTKKLERWRLLGVCLFAAAALGVVVWFVLVGQSATTVENAVWLSGSEGPVLLVHERLARDSDSGSYTVNRMLQVDPRTGRVRRQSNIEVEKDAPLTVMSGRGSHYFAYQGDAWQGTYTLLGLDDSGQSIKSLEPQYPSVLAPWYNYAPLRDGLLLVESDDKHVWQIDIVSKLASDVTGRATILRFTGAPFFGCYTDQLSELHWHFKEIPSERHSQRDMGLYADERLILKGLRYPRFACDAVRGPVKIGSDPILLETAPVTYSLLDEQGQRRWSWSPPALEPDTQQPADIFEAWAFEGGVILRTNRLFVSLDPHGKERWRLSR